MDQRAELFVGERLDDRLDGLGGLGPGERVDGETAFGDQPGREPSDGEG